VASDAPALPRYDVGQPVVVHHDKPWQRGRPVRMRGVVESFRGEELVVARWFRSPGLKYDGLNARQERGDRGLIAVRRGAWISVRRYFRRDGRPIGELYNVQTPTELAPGLARYVDLEVDVARQGAPGAEVIEVQDLDDLERAAAGGGVPPALAELARELAEEVAGRLRAARGGAVDWDVRPGPGRLIGPVAEFLARA
jgi:hypothetical protein